MKRVLCVWLPNWPLQRWWLTHNGPAELCAGQRVESCAEQYAEKRAEPHAEFTRHNWLAIYDEARGTTRVVTCSHLARAAGVVPGMPVAEAKALARQAGAQPQQPRQNQPRQNQPRQNQPRQNQPRQNQLRQNQLRQNQPRQNQLRQNQLRQPHQETLLVAHDCLADRQQIDALVDWCRQFSPAVGLEAAEKPSSLLLDIAGCAHLFGGEVPLVEAVLERFGRRGLTVHAAVADTVGAAWAVAQYGPQAAAGELASSSTVVGCGEQAVAVAELPVVALRIADDTVRLLHELGIRRIGQLARLARRSLPARFGLQLVERLDQAHGRRDELVVLPEEVAPLCETCSFEYAQTRLDGLLWELERLAAGLAAELARRDEGARQLRLWLHWEGGGSSEVALGLFRPSASAEHLVELLAMRLERQNWSRPVTALRLEAVETARLERAQLELFASGSRRDHRRQLGLLIDRLSSRLGREAVLRPRLLADAQPEHAYRFEPWVASQQRTRRSKPRAPGAQNIAGIVSGRPLRLSRRPRALEVMAVAPEGPPIQFRLGRDFYRIACSWGPERIETSWWRGRTVRRDYYRVETETGQRFWLFRRLPDARWFWHGTFD